MLKKVKEYIARHRLIDAGDHIILGVSGGPDSMALLHIMVALSGPMHFRITVAHVNHGLRPEADEEEVFIAAVCRVMGVECFTRRVMVDELARTRKSGLEETGRLVRYDFFEAVRQDQGGQRIATAHHSDDAAESVLLHLLRGSGIKGLRGIMPINGSVIRPLLGVSKDEISAYIAKNQIPHRCDPTNQDQYYLRNRIRHKLMPLLKQEFNPRIVDKLNQLGAIARDENQVMEEQTKELWRSIVLQDDITTVILDNQGLSLVPRAFRRRIVQKALFRIAVAEWSMGDVEMVLEFSAREQGGSARALHLKKKVRVIKSYDRIIFTIRPVERVRFLHELPVPGRMTIPATGDSYQTMVVDRQDYGSGLDGVGLDYGCLPQPLFLRSRQAGDYFFLTGMKGRKKLKKYLIENRVPYYDRDRIVLLTGPGHEVYAALGLFVSDQAMVKSQTESVLWIRAVSSTTSGNDSQERRVE